MPISLVTDSTSDVPPAYVERYNIRVVPSLLVINDQPYKDEVEMPRGEYYQKLSTLNPLPTTAAPASGEFEAAYNSCPAGPIISIHTASTLSALYNSARLGAEAFGDRVTVADSGSLSLGVGWQLIAAAEAIASGATLEQTLEVVTSTRRRLKVYALLSTVENLRRSGRLSLVRASIINILQIKPTIELVNGTATAISQDRTSKKAMAGFIQRVRALGRLERLGIMYTDNIELAHEVQAAVSDLCSNPALLMQASPTIGTHIGPHAVAVAVVKYE